MNLKKNIPNIITLLNLFCGCIALVFVANNQFEIAFYFVCLGIFLDFFDGFFARLFKVSSPLGLQLDSLADMVTSGVVPGFVMYKMVNEYTNYNPILPYLGFIITLGSCYRLANFNIDTRQTDSFIGLPTPANTLFIMSLPLIGLNHFMDFNFIHAFLLIISLLSAYIMNAEIPLFSLKIKKMSFDGNELQIIFLLLSLLLIGFFQFLGVVLVIIFYVLLSIIMNILKRK
jgi:CDP-diacylglycerol--serine O-phosphatidyltransferase